MRTATLFIKVISIVLIIPLILANYDLVRQFNLKNPQHLWFTISCVGSFLLASIVVKTHGYFAILLHELTHNLLAIITFNKPVALNVKAHQGGNFQFTGRQNILSLLAPYFFPTLSFLWLLIYFIISPNSITTYLIILGLTYGLTQSIAIRQAHWKQPDFYTFGVFWSYTFILFFQLIVMGALVGFVLHRFNGSYTFLKSIFTELIGLVNQIPLLLANV